MMFNRIDDVSLERNILGRGWRFHLEMAGFKFTGYFDDFGGFITMITECAKFFAVKAGKLHPKDAGLTREVRNNAELS